MRDSIRYNVPLFGMNCGHVGFLMNEFEDNGLPERIEAADRAELHPLQMAATSVQGKTYEALAMNEVALLRQTHNAAHCAISVNDKQEMELLICDGVMVATPAGSTAYNLSAHGPILPIGADLLALTPISAFRPRRWRGALLPGKSRVRIEVLEPDFRSQSVTADNVEFRDIAVVDIWQRQDISVPLLYDPGRGLPERILSEQFAP